MVSCNKILLSIILFVFCQICFAQNTTLYSVTEYPSVGNQTKSTYATMKIKRVFLGAEGTLVEFSYNPAKNLTGGWISMSSGTIMKTKLSTVKYKIQNWGYVDSEGSYKQLNFNEKYNVDAGGSYVFYMGFEGVKNPTNIISIFEDGYNGFYWENIRLNDFDSNSNSNKQSDKQELIAKFIVTSAKNNGYDVTQQVVNQGGAYTVFYSVGNETYMANYMEKKDSQSWGVIYDFTSETTEETSEAYKTDVFKFSWNYQNSYDSKTGTCKCSLTKVYKPQGIVSILKMVTESLDVIEYTGYMDGSVDFSKF